MSTVMKWTVPVDDHDHPIGSGKVLLVACQETPRLVQIWTEEPGPRIQTRSATVIGTGHTVPPNTEHLGSTMAAAGALVWHLYGGPTHAKS